jgi:hypothetical protein
MTGRRTGRARRARARRRLGSRPKHPRGLVSRRPRSLGAVAPLSLHGAALTSASFGPDGTAALVITGHHGAVITSGQAWKTLPDLPPGTAPLAPGPAGTFQALAVHWATLTIWQTGAQGTSWHDTQTINVPAQYGSSG